MLAVVWIACVILSAALLGRYNKAGSGFLLGFFLGPLGLIITLIWRINLAADECTRHEATLLQAIQGDSADRPMRDCPYCAERILAAATLCKHCKSAVDPLDVQPRLTGTGICPNCLHDGLDVNLTQCPHCQAHFTAATGQKVIRTSP
jgi:hypothetical protein